MKPGLLAVGVIARAGRAGRWGRISRRGPQMAETDTPFGAAHGLRPRRFYRQIRLTGSTAMRWAACVGRRKARRSARTSSRPWRCPDGTLELVEHHQYGTRCCRSSLRPVPPMNLRCRRPPTPACAGTAGAPCRSAIMSMGSARRDRCPATITRETLTNGRSCVTPGCCTEDDPLPSKSRFLRITKGTARQLTRMAHDDRQSLTRNVTDSHKLMSRSNWRESEHATYRSLPCIGTTLRTRPWSGSA